MPVEGVCLRRCFSAAWSVSNGQQLSQPVRGVTRDGPRFDAPGVRRRRGPADSLLELEAALRAVGVAARRESLPRGRPLPGLGREVESARGLARSDPEIVGDVGTVVRGSGAGAAGARREAPSAGPAGLPDPVDERKATPRGRGGPPAAPVPNADRPGLRGPSGSRPDPRLPGQAERLPRAGSDSGRRPQLRATSEGGRCHCRALAGAPAWLIEGRKDCDSAAGDIRGAPLRDPVSAMAPRSALDASFGYRSIFGASGHSVERGTMETRLQALEEKVTRLGERVEQVEQQLAALPPLVPAWPESGPHLPELPSAGVEMARWVTLLGRSCVVLGGAFLIRALTDRGILPSGAGVALGLAFAATWVFFSHRAGARGATLSAGFHGVTAALIAYPLVLETTTRLGAMSTGVAALTLVGFTALLLGVSWRDRLGWLAWIGVLSCLLTTLVLLGDDSGTSRAGRSAPRPGGRDLLARGPSAMGRASVAPRPGSQSGHPSCRAHLHTAGARLLTLARRPVPGPGVFSDGGLRPSGGRVRGPPDAGGAGHWTGRSAPSVGRGRARLRSCGGGGAHRVAARRVLRGVDRSSTRQPRLDLLFYASLSLGLLTFGVTLLTAGDLRGVLWSILALLTAFLGRRRHPGWFWWFAALLAVGASFSTALMGQSWQALVGHEPSHWLAMSPGSVTVLGLVVLTYVVTVPPLPSGARPPTAAWSRLPAAALLLLCSTGLATLVLAGLPPLHPRSGTPRHRADAGRSGGGVVACTDPAACGMPGAHVDCAPRSGPWGCRAGRQRVTEWATTPVARLLRRLRSRPDSDPAPCSPWS